MPKPLLPSDDAAFLTRMVLWAATKRVHSIAEAPIKDVIRLYILAAYEDTENYATLIADRDHGATTVGVFVGTIIHIVADARARHSGRRPRSK